MLSAKGQPGLEAGTRVCLRVGTDRTEPPLSCIQRQWQGLPRPCSNSGLCWQPSAHYKEQAGSHTWTLHLVSVQCLDMQANLNLYKFKVTLTATMHVSKAEAALCLISPIPSGNTHPRNREGNFQPQLFRHRDKMFSISQDIVLGRRVIQCQLKGTKDMYWNSTSRKAFQLFLRVFQAQWLMLCNQTDATILTIARTYSL